MGGSRKRTFERKDGLLRDTYRGADGRKGVMMMPGSMVGEPVPDANRPLRRAEIGGDDAMRASRAMDALADEHSPEMLEQLLIALAKGNRRSPCTKAMLIALGLFLGACTRHQIPLVRSLAPAPGARSSLARAVLRPSWSELRSFHDGCSLQASFSDACRAAVHRYCKAQVQEGFVSGFGMVEMSSNDVQVVCLTDEVVTLVLTDIKTLSTFHRECSAQTTNAPACRAAVRRFCRAGGRAAGFGPVETDGNSAWVACTKNALSYDIGASFADLLAMHPDCTSAGGIATQGCVTAVHRFCDLRGYLSGYGPYEEDANATFVALACIEASPRTVIIDPRYAAAQISNRLWSRTLAVPYGTAGACNSTRFARVPDTQDLYIGRYSFENNCNDWYLSVAKSDAVRHEFNEVHDIIRPPVKISMPDGDYVITAALDPTIMKLGQDLFVAFECNGSRLGSPSEQGAFGKTNAATCLGWLDRETFQIDLTRTEVVITGDSVFAAEHVSASVPKLLVYQGRPYLYWTAVSMDAQMNWQHVTTRGVALDQDPVSGNLWARGHHGPILADDPDSVEVWGLGTSPRTNSAADVFDVKSDGRHVFATAGVGGNGCLRPTDPREGCYRLAIAQAEYPLGIHVFDRAIVNDSGIPAHEYSTFIDEPFSGGALSLMMEFPLEAAFVMQMFRMSAGMDQSQAPLCDPNTQQTPAWGIRRSQCLPSCSKLGGRVSLNDRTCAAARLRSAGESYDAEFCCF